MQESSLFLTHRRSMRAALVALALIAIFLFSAALGMAPVSRAALVAAGEDSTTGAHDAAGPLKAVIIVGPTHGLTASNKERGIALANQAESLGMDVRRVFHPNATWANVLANIQGAHLVAYFGHGNGWPSPYGPFQEKTKNGFGLNPFEGAGQNKVEYYGANKIRANVTLASNAVVLLNHLCYAAGNGESFMAIPSLDVARQRVDNFAAGFLAVGAGAVFAYTSQSVGSVLSALFGTDKTMEDIFTTAGSKPQPYFGFVGWNPRKFDSERMPGFRNFLDPHADSGFQRALSGKLKLSAAEWRNGVEGGTPPPDDEEDPTPPPAVDTTPPSAPGNLTTESLGYRRVKLTWEASTDNQAGTIKYRVLRNGKRIATVTSLSFTDRPANPGTYRYKVRAVDAAGNMSTYSAIVEGYSIKGKL